MLETIGTELRRPVPLLLAALALLGWIVAIGFMVSRASVADRLETAETERSDLAAQLQTQQQASGELADLQARLASTNDEVTQITRGREAAQQELAAAQGALADAQRQADERRAELTQLTAELQTSRAELEAKQGQLTETENSVAARSQELADVGQRLETARAQEVQSRATLAQLAEEAAKASAQVSEAEQRIQQARQSEAETEKQITDARDEAIRLTEERRNLDQAVVELAARRQALADDSAKAEQRRTELQSEITRMSETLAARSQELAALETRIGELQGRGANLGDAAGLGLQPGRYSAGPVEVTFAADGAFKMQQKGRERLVTGRYKIDEGVLTLFDAIGETGNTQFPMACRVQPEALGFRLAKEGNTCAVFDGVSFERQG